MTHSGRRAKASTPEAAEREAFTAGGDGGFFLSAGIIEVYRDSRVKQSKQVIYRLVTSQPKAISRLGNSYGVLSEGLVPYLPFYQQLALTLSDTLLTSLSVLSGLSPPSQRSKRTENRKERREKRETRKEKREESRQRRVYTITKTIAETERNAVT